MPDPTIALALSGGGFRATLFHLGVVRFLYEAQLLHKVTHICAVSGGSILAAHLVQNWDLYNGDAAAFDDAAGKIADFVQKDVRGRVVRRWLFSLLNPIGWLLRGRWARARLLEVQYEQLYGKATLDMLAEAKGGGRKPPELHLLVTNMTTGDLCSFSQPGFSWTTAEGEDRTMMRSLPVARAVAASSAFPPLFPPVKLTHKDLKCTGPEFYSDPQYLADGGVFDNLGIRKLHRLQKKDGLHFDFIVVSDAQNMFDWAVGSAFAFLPTRASRASSILMKRVSDLEYEVLEGAPAGENEHYVRCRLQDQVLKEEDPLSLKAETQRDVRGVRTDLDVFSLEEIDALVAHGYAVARRAWKEAGPPGAPVPGADRRWSVPRHKKALQLQSGIENLSESSTLKWRLWALRDWASWAMSLTVLGYLSLFLWPYLRALSKQEGLEKQVEQLATDVQKLQEAFVDASDAYARRLGLPGPTAGITFVRPSSANLLGTWDPQERRYNVNLEKVGTPGLAEFVAIDGWFMARHYEECFADDEPRVDVVFWLEFRYSLAHYVLSSTDPRKQDTLLATTPWANGPLFKAFTRMERELGNKSESVRRLALALLERFECEWTSETLSAKAIAVNQELGLIKREDVIGKAFVEAQSERP